MGSGKWTKGEDDSTADLHSATLHHATPATPATFHPPCEPHNLPPFLSSPHAMDVLLLAKPWTEITACVSYTALHPHTHSPTPSPAFLSALTRPSPFTNPSTLPPPPRRLPLRPHPASTPERLWLKFVYDASGYTLLVTDWVRVWRRRATAADVEAEKEEHAAGVQLQGVVDTLQSWVEPLLTGRTRQPTQRLSHWSHEVRFEQADGDDDAAPPSTLSPSPSLPLSPPPSSLSRWPSSLAADAPPPPAASYAHVLVLTCSLQLEALPVYWRFRCEPCGTAFDQAMVLRHLAMEPLLLTTKRLWVQCLSHAKAGRQAVKDEVVESRAHAPPPASRRDGADERRRRARAAAESSQSSSPASQLMESEAAEVSVPTLDELYEESMRQVSQSQSHSYGDVDAGVDEAAAEDAAATAPSQRAEAGQRGELSQSETASAAADTDGTLDSGRLDAAAEYVETEAEKATQEAKMRCPQRPAPPRARSQPTRVSGVHRCSPLCALGCARVKEAGGSEEEQEKEGLRVSVSLDAARTAVPLRRTAAATVHACALDRVRCGDEGLVARSARRGAAGRKSHQLSAQPRVTRGRDTGASCTRPLQLSRARCPPCRHTASASCRHGHGRGEECRSQRRRHKVTTARRHTHANHQESPNHCRPP